MPLNSQSLDRILRTETTVSATITSNTAFTLPSAANMAGKLYTIYNPSASTANVLVNAADASLVVTVQPGSAAVVTPISDVPATNAAWMVVTNGVNASGVKGRTDGSAVAAGYVGEKIVGTLANNGTTYPSGGSSINVWQLPLTAGVWMLYGTVAASGSTATSSAHIAEAGFSTSNTGFSLGRQRGVMISGGEIFISAPPTQVTISASATYYMNASMTYPSGTYTNNTDTNAFAIRIA